MNITSEELKNLMIELGCGNTQYRKDVLCNMLQKYNINYFVSQSYKSYPTTNIIIPAISQQNKIVVSAHYDVVWNSKGYNDNGSGVLSAFLVGLNNINSNVEIVFTDREELGGGGADLYIFENLNNIKYNINLDVCGLPDTVYIDNNIVELTQWLSTFDSTNYRFGLFPFCDGHVFRESNIPSISFSSGPSIITEPHFSKGISYIFSTIHNNKYDNDISMISFEMIQKVSKIVLETINILNNNI